MSYFLLADDIPEGVCRIMKIPWTDESGTVEFPILAAHYNRIEKVLVRATDGTTTIETEVTSKSTYTGYSRKLWCWVASLDFSLLSDGNVTVTAYSIPKTRGKSRKTSEVYINDSGGSATPGTTIYVKNSGSDTNDGLTSATAVKTFIQALTKLVVNTELRGTIVFDEAGTYDGSGSAAFTMTDDPWVTVKAGPNVTDPKTVILTTFGSTKTAPVFIRPKVRHLKIQDISIDHNGMYYIYNDETKNEEIWLDNVKWFDSGGRATSGSEFDHGSIRNVRDTWYASNSRFTDCYNGVNGAKLAIDCDMDTLLNDAFALCLGSVNCTVTDSDALTTIEHPDFFQFFSDRYQNRAHSGMRGLDSDVQGIYHDHTGYWGRDALYENCAMDMKTSTTAFISQWYGVNHGTICEHCTWSYQGFQFRTDQTDKNKQYSGSMNRFTNCCGKNCLSSNTGLTPVPNRTVKFEGCIWEQTPSDASWGTVSASLGFANQTGNDFRPSGSGAAIYRSGVSYPDLPPGDDGVGIVATPNVGAWGDAAGAGFSGGTYSTPNSPPTITTTPGTGGTVGFNYSYDANATDPENDPLTWSLVSGPTGMTINSTTGLVSWTPTSGQVGANAVTIRVTDGTNNVDQSWTITVSAASSGKAAFWNWFG